MPSLWWLVAVSPAVMTTILHWEPIKVWYIYLHIYVSGSIKMLPALPQECQDLISWPPIKDSDLAVIVENVSIYLKEIDYIDHTIIIEQNKSYPDCPDMLQARVILPVQSLMHLGSETFLAGWPNSSSAPVVAPSDTLIGLHNESAYHSHPAPDYKLTQEQVILCLHSLHSLHYLHLENVWNLTSGKSTCVAPIII